MKRADLKYVEEEVVSWLRQIGRGDASDLERHSCRLESAVRMRVVNPDQRLRISHAIAERTIAIGLYAATNPDLE